jgi:hypothetical protein
MSDYLKMKALVSSQVLRQQNFASEVKKNVCDFTEGTAIAGKPAISGTQSIDYSMVPLYSNTACTVLVGSITFYDMLLNIEDNYTIYEKGILSFTKRDASGKIINSPTVRYEYSQGSNSDSVFFADLSSHTFRIDGYGMDGSQNLLDLLNAKLTIDISGKLRTVSFSGGNVGSYSLLNGKQYYYTLDDFAFAGHPGRCNDYYYSAHN